jgi:hypothetical protein
MMEGHRVTVERLDEGPVTGTLVKMNELGVMIHDNVGFNDERTFVPMGRISSIIDLGRA